MSELCGDLMPTTGDQRPTCILPAGHESRVHRSAPPVYVWAPLHETGDEPDCKECGHLWKAHSKTYGCGMEWVYDSQGISTVDGCGCLLSHLDLSPEGK